MNRFHNYSDGFLADQIGRAAAASKTIEDELDELKAEVKRRGIETATGEQFTITVSHSTRDWLDTKLAQAVLGKALTPFMRTRPVTTVRSSKVFQQPTLEG